MKRENIYVKVVVRPRDRLLQAARLLNKEAKKKVCDFARITRITDLYLKVLNHRISRYKVKEPRKRP